MWVLKQCTKCKEYKELNDFSKHEQCRFGRNSFCRGCKSQAWKDNREYHLKKRREYYQQNKRESHEYTLRYYKKRRAKDPMFRLKMNVRRAIHKGLTKKNKSSEDILGCSFDFFRQHIERQFTKGMTWDNHGEWHLDHIVPLASAETEEDVYRLNHYTNFQPLWGKENISKNAKIPEGHQPKLPI